MRKRTKIIITLSCALGASLALALGACAPGKDRESTIDSLLENGEGVIVRYDKNGGIFNSDEENDIFYIYSLSDVQNGGVKLFAPVGKLPGTETASRTERSGYTLVGWYRSMQLRVDEEGNPVDDEGNICHIRRLVTEDGVPVKDEEGNLCYELVSDAGKPQGQVFSDPWDFENDRLTFDKLDPDEYDYGHGKTIKSFHLYAAWVPVFNYAFYRQNEEGEWVQYGEKTLPENSTSIPVPSWEGSLDYSTVPQYKVEEDKTSGTPAKSYTLTGLYADPELKQPYYKEDGGNIFREETIPHYGTVNEENGTSQNATVRLYTTWKEGNWFRISTAEQLASHTLSDGCYEILADLDFSQSAWTFSGYTFTGKFFGNGHTISNITARQNNTSQRIYGGLFGTLTAETHIENISFENVEFYIEAGASKTTVGGGPAEASFGLFAGAVQGVTAENIHDISLEGTIYIGGYDLISASIGNGDNKGKAIDAFNVGLVAGNLFEADLNTFLGYGITAQVRAEAALHISKYDDDGFPIYDKTLDVQFVDDATNENFGKVTMTVL